MKLLLPKLSSRGSLCPLKGGALIFLFSAAFTSCSVMLQPAACESQEVYPFEDKEVVVSLKELSELNVLGYHLEGSKMVFVLKCKNKQNSLINFNPSLIQAFGVDRNGSQISLTVDATSEYYEIEMLSSIVDEGFDCLTDFGRIAIQADSHAVSDKKVESIPVEEAHTYINIRDSKIDQISLLENQEVLGVVVVDAHAKKTKRFVLSIPIGNEQHRVEFFEGKASKKRLPEEPHAALALQYLD